MIPPSLLQKARFTYRSLLKSQQLAFKGDTFALKAAKETTRQKFIETKSVTDPSELEKLLQDAEEIASYLRHNLIQAKLKNDNIYELKIDPTRHEINDNNDVKKPYVKQKRVPCCGPNAPKDLPRI